MNNDVILYYDKLIDENNDPVNDPQQLKEYMDKWYGQLFIDKMQYHMIYEILMAFR